MKRASYLVALGLVVGCSHSLPLPGQVLLFVDTDALLPVPAGQSGARPALFDALAVDVFLPGDDDPCGGCTQQFALDETTVNAGKASVGIPMQPHTSGYRARVRLYHTTALSAGPRPDGAIETVVALPPVDDTGELAVTVFLATDDLAAPSGTLDAPVDPVLGSVTVGHAGTWASGASTPCQGSPSDNEVCVPGGAFWMGNVAASFAGGLGAATDVQRIVVVSPFFIDAYEATVGDFRGSALTGVGLWTGSTAGTNPNDWCSYSSSAARDDLPMNCLSWSAAQNYCVSKGAALPTEAQLEYLEGALQSSLYVWGGDDPICTDAVFGLTGFGISWGSGDGECRLPLAFGGPLKPFRDHTSSRDVLTIDGQSIYDLAGNMSEWPIDTYEPQGGDCWPTGVLHDPVCSTGSARLVRGGSWVTPGESLRAAARVPLDDVGAPNIGVRCARSDGP